MIWTSHQQSVGRSILALSEQAPLLLVRPHSMPFGSKDEKDRYEPTAIGGVKKTNTSLNADFGQGVQKRPVLPNPPSPRAVSLSSDLLTSSNEILGTGAMTS